MMLKNVDNIKKKYNLKPKELLFLHLLFKNKFDVPAAWRECHPNSTARGRSENTLASRFYQQIKQKINFRENYLDYLELCGVGLSRLTEEIEKGLSAMKTEFYKGIPVATCEDNSTRAKTRELLADILGVRKNEIKNITDNSKNINIAIVTNPDIIRDNELEE